MRVSIAWLQQLVKLQTSLDETVNLLNQKSIATKEVTDQFIELDMKGYNRADLLSMRGVALEIAAITSSTIAFEDLTVASKLLQDLTPNTLDVKVNNSDFCPLYCLVKIEGLTVAKSTKEIATKIEQSGMRTINNIADITNLVMLEYGQPLHAFDASSVVDEKIIIRTAKSNEELITLDNKLRKLESDDLLITDLQKVLGIAGIMGGKDSEITENTTSILLEAAIFNPANIRKTSTHLGLSSEASKRFLHGLTKDRLFQAFLAAIKHYQTLGGQVTALTIIDNLKQPEISIVLNLDKINSLIGLELTEQQIESYLSALYFNYQTTKKGEWTVQVPYWRLDIAIEEDLIEEIARMYGYDKIPAKKLPGIVPEQIDQTLFKTISQLKIKLVGLGLTEVQTYSFYSTNTLNALNLDRSKRIKIANPISSETEYMKDMLWPNLIEVATNNLKYFKDVAIFEIGKIYQHSEEGNPKEHYRLAIAISNNTDNPIAELNKIIEQLEIKTHQKPSEERNELFHPTRQLVAADSEIAEVHPRIINKLGSEKRIAIAEIKINSSFCH